MAVVVVVVVGFQGDLPDLHGRGGVLGKVGVGQLHTDDGPLGAGAGASLTVTTLLDRSV